MHVDESNPTPSKADEWPVPTPEQLDLIRRILAPHVRRARAEQAEQQTAA
ncbi:hypothetical protein [Streptomyces catenulae]|uniref:Uncharacterized protein n=1 Tax=Streptomyces catenulae TaxID=66875 RepID=A0ABV2YXP0_9ACTN|nr:hypothetical protein [Streptomyces catenulae]